MAPHPQRVCMYCDAGITGVLSAVCATVQRQAAPTISLRNVNPYVESTLRPYAGSRKRAQVPREQQPWSAFGPTHYGSTSSFGMSGVNAHAVLGSAVKAQQCDASLVRHPDLLWRRASYWPTPSRHSLITAAVKTANQANVHVDIAVPSSGYLHDHVVQGTSHKRPKMRCATHPTSSWSSRYTLSPGVSIPSSHI